MIALTVDNKTVNLPVWVLPGQPDNTVTVHLGYGRRRTGNVGAGAGVDVYPLRSSSNSWYAAVDEIEKIDGTYQLAATHTHQTMADRALPVVGDDVTPEVVKEPIANESAEHELANRNLIRTATLEQFIADSKVITAMEEKTTRLSLYPGEFKALYDQNFQWGMSIDLGSCIGCNACVVACQAENNIAVVGKEQVLARPRDALDPRRHLLRRANSISPRPITSRSPACTARTRRAKWSARSVPPCTITRGLNNMVYNRCIGTRYCSNNCPYKVRRFNFFDFR